MQLSLFVHGLSLGVIHVFDLLGQTKVLESLFWSLWYCSDLLDRHLLYEGYCKGCFTTIFPVKAAELRAGNKKACATCGAKRELTGQLCRPCNTARTCNDCGDINMAANASTCANCHVFRDSLGAATPRLSLWYRFSLALQESWVELPNPVYPYGMVSVFNSNDHRSKKGAVVFVVSCSFWSFWRL